jgi:hypothetical protein
MTSSVEAGDLGRSASTTRVRVGYSLGSLVTGSFGTFPGLLLLPYLDQHPRRRAGAALHWCFCRRPGMSCSTRLSAASPIAPKPGGVARDPICSVAGWASCSVHRYLRRALRVVRAPRESTWPGCSCSRRPLSPFSRYLTSPCRRDDGFVLRADPHDDLAGRPARHAILVAGAGAPYILDKRGGGITGHRWMALFVGAIMLTGTLIVFFSTAKASPGDDERASRRCGAQLRVAWENGPSACWSRASWHRRPGARACSPGCATSRIT